MRTHRSTKSGYSLAELLVVVAIVGIMSLVSVPMFMQYQQQARLKSSLRIFAADLRNARQVAIARYLTIRMEFTSSKRYVFTYKAPGATTWTAMPISILTNPSIPLNVTPVQAYREMSEPITIYANTFGDLDGNGKKDILFNSDGTITNPDTTISGGTVTVVSPWTRLTYDRMVVTIASSGGITSVPSHS
jgi:prepilin-type N-terminal cleavage/methylation domain-containing protein